MKGYEERVVRGYEADAAIHEAVEYIHQMMQSASTDDMADLVHLLDVLGGELPDWYDEEGE